jgi:hypothetical protein
MRALLITTLIVVGACGGDDPKEEATWQRLAAQRPSALLAVWAASAEDVWVVGGREGLGMPPTVYHYDGAAWTKHDPGVVNVDLWQVFGFPGGPVFLGGSNGTILRYQNGTFEKITTPATDIVFGLWGSAPDDVWAVGGQTAGRAFVWRLRGAAFEPVPGAPPELMNGTVWKVTGRAANDVWMSATSGLVLHWDGQALSNERIGRTEESLFSIGCGGTRCVTAGTNISNGVLYQNDGSGWTSRVPTNDGPVWRGVTPMGEHTYVVGAFGAVLRFEGGRWVSDPHGLSTESLHAAWSDADGNLFAVGGKFDRVPTIDGVLLFKGATQLPPLP